MEAKKIAVGSDHAALELKQQVIEHLKSRGIEVIDCGAYSADSVDYPDFAEGVAGKVTGGEADLGILICGTGIGMSIAANKMPGIRAALVTDLFMAEMAGEHNRANILCLGARLDCAGDSLAFVDKWLGATFEQRHQKRLDKISTLEKKYRSCGE